MTAEMYEQAGGLPSVRTPEDVAFYRALVRVNARFRHSPKVRVVTSARQTGRTSQGLANQLNKWAAMGRQQQPFLVEPAAAIETRLRGRHGLRVQWRRILNGYQPTYRDISPLANHLGVATGWLLTSSLPRLSAEGRDSQVYGLGTAAYSVYFMYLAKEEYKTTHFAISTGIMALGMMLPGLVSGYIQQALGYQALFILGFLLTIPRMLTIFFIPLDSESPNP